jgi:transcriptional regulator with XRE-family HTH domain
MKLADKLIRLRKKIGWSQEELAEKMDVSRQSISKWEGAASIPDLNKIIQLSQIFGVTTDFLLKDEIEEEVFSEGDFEEGYTKISLNDVKNYMNTQKTIASIISRGVLLCIYSVIPLLILISFAQGNEPLIAEATAVAIGIPVLLVVVVIAVAMFIRTGQYSKTVELYDKGTFELEYGVESIIREKAEENNIQYYKKLPIMVAFYIVSVIPIVIAGSIDATDQVMILMIVVLLFIVGLVTSLLIPLSTIKESYEKILHEGEFDEESKKDSAKEDKIASIYWPIVVALFLAWSFLTHDWGITWVVFPVAGLIYASITAIFLNTKH